VAVTDPINCVIVVLLILKWKKPMDTVDSNEKLTGCQSAHLDRISEPLSLFEIVWQFRYKLKRVLKRRLTYLRNQFSRTVRVADASIIQEETAMDQALVSGQSVRVRSREEIQATLDSWNYLKGCGFMEEMWQYCGTTQRVLKPVERFLDERDYRVKKARGVFILEGVHCQGTIDYGRCDRNCYYFWREEWLVKDNLVENRPPETSGK
jgi:hypothetical protein